MSMRKSAPCRLATAIAEMQTLPFVREGVARFRVEKFD